MNKTRTLRRVSISSGKTRKIRSMKRSPPPPPPPVHVQFETPASADAVASTADDDDTAISSVRSSFGQPRVLFKKSKANLKPPVTYQLGVTYNVIATPPSPDVPSNHPLARCRKCKHHHGKAANGPVAKGPLAEPSISKCAQTPVAANQSFTSSILQQVKANIVISPYVRHYLERKLKEKLQKTDIGQSKLLHSINFGQLELVYNLDQGEEEIDQRQQSSFSEFNVPKYFGGGGADTPAPTVRGRTRTIRTVSGIRARPKTSVGLRKAASKTKALLQARSTTTTGPTPAHQYFTRTQARKLQQTKQQKRVEEDSSKATVLSDDELFTPLRVIKTRYATRTTTNKAVMDKPLTSNIRNTRHCKTMAGNENLRKAKTKMVAQPAITPAVVPSTDKSKIPRFSGVLKK